MSPITLYISVSTYLSFEVSHNYTPGRNSCYWRINQFNGPATEPMTSHLFGGEEVAEFIIKHLLTEIANYGQPTANSTYNLLMRIQNGDAICYEGLLQTHSVDRFKTIFELFTYMVPNSPL